MRVLVLLLIVVNAAYFAWSQGFLKSAGLAPAVQSEPERVAQQIKPESVRLLPQVEFKRIEEQSKAEQAARECLQAGPLTAEQSAALRPLLEKNFPEGGWSVQEQPIPARWMVYIGKFPNDAALVKKRAELTGLNVHSEPVVLAALQPGLSLGVYETKDRANEELARLATRGVHSARVLLERAESVGYQLKLPSVPEALKPRLTDLKPVLAAVTLKTCE